MKTIQERLAEEMAQLERQTAEWDRAMKALAALGDAPLRVPDAVLTELDAVVHRVHAAAGGMPV
jgi:hypothetical protein